MHYYADSSALVQRHIEEGGSVWVRTHLIVSPAALIVTSDISVVEIFSALNRRVREGPLTPTTYQTLRADVVNLCATTYQCIELSLAIHDRAAGLLEQHALRAFDAIQLASALSAHEAIANTNAGLLTFVSADQRLLDAARNILR